MDLAKDIAIVAASVIALGTLIVGVIEYFRQGAAKRVEHFLEMRRRFKENQKFKTITDLLLTDDEGLRDIPVGDKLDYLGFFEEIALSMNSRLINKNVAHYMFSYYAIRCWESENFRRGINCDSIYWQAFRDFVEQMKEIEQGFRFRRKNFQF